jgi:hypothetical protein
VYLDTAQIVPTGKGADMREHGEKYTQPFIVDNGRKVFTKNMHHCALCGGVDLFLFPNFDTDHGAHVAKFTPSHGAYVELRKVFGKAA